MIGLPFTIVKPKLSEQELTLLSSEIVGQHILKLDLDRFWRRLEGCPVNQKIMFLDQGCPDPINADAFVNEKYSHVPSGTFIDGGGHGAHTFCICLAIHNNNYGIKGVSITGLGGSGKVIEDNGVGALEYYMNGLKTAIDNGYDFVNASIGSEAPLWQEIKDLQKEAKEKSVSIQIAAGNAYEGLFNTMAENSHVLSVGSVSNNKRRSEFSSKSPWLDISAYGEDILSFTTGEDIRPMSGTSQATAVVTGILADCKSYAQWKGLDLTVDELWDIARNTADDIEDDGPDEKTGFGIINPNAMLDEIDRIIEGAPIRTTEPIAEAEKKNPVTAAVIIVIVLSAILISLFV